MNLDVIIIAVVIQGISLLAYETSVLWTFIIMFIEAFGLILISMEDE